MRFAANAFVGFALFVTLSNVLCAFQAHTTRRPGRPSPVFMASFVLGLAATPLVFHAYRPRAAVLCVESLGPGSTARLVSVDAELPLDAVYRNPLPD